MKLSIFATSDLHGYVLPTDYTATASYVPIGLAKLATVLTEKQKEADCSITLDNGDTLQGSPLAQYLALRSATNSPEPLMNLFNQLHYDAMVIGNHEFNFGRDYLEKARHLADFPFLCANVLKEDGSPAVGDPYRIIEKCGMKIAILGLVTHFIPKWEKKENIEGLTFVSPVEVAQQYVPWLKEQADIVIVAYHGGFDKNLKNGKPIGPQNGENAALDILREVPGIDALITGHQHQALQGYAYGVPFIQPGWRGNFLGEISFEIGRKNGRWQIESAVPLLHDVAEAEADQSMTDAVWPVHMATEAWLDEPLGRVEGDMSIKDPIKSRAGNHPYVELVNHIQLLASGADASATAIFTATAPGLQGEITVRSIINNYIYNNTLAVLEITGEDLLKALERCAAFFDIDEETGELIISEAFRTPFTQYYNYDIYDGITYTFDIRKPVGERVVLLQKDGEDIQPNDVLTLVLNNYRAVGGGEYVMFSAEKIIRDLQVDMTDLVMMYVRAHPVLHTETKDNFKVLY